MRAAGLLADDFRAVDFRAVDFLAVDFRAVDLVPVDLREEADALLELAPIFFAELPLPEFFLALDGFDRVLLEPVLLLADPLRLVLFEPLLALDLLVAITSSSYCRDWRVGLFHSPRSKCGLHGGVV